MENKHKFIYRSACDNRTDMSKNTLHFLKNRETNGGINLTEKNFDDMLAFRLKQLHLKQEIPIGTSDMSVIDCNFLRPGFENNSLLAAFNGFPYPGMLYRLNVTFRSACSKEESPPLIAKIDIVGPHLAMNQIADACFYKTRNGTEENVAYVMCHKDEGMSIIVFSILENGSEVDIQYAVKCEVFSCAFNSARERFVAGTSHKLYIFDSLRFTHFQSVPGMPMAVEFNKAGDLIYMGDYCVGLRVYDTRTPPMARTCSVLFPGAVTDFKLLSDEYTVVLNKWDELINVDLRTGKPVLSYEGPKDTFLKSPFSIDENTDTLCSTGLDNITYVWSLNSGKVLHYIYPSLTYQSVRSCLVSDRNQYAIVLFQKNWAYIFEPEIF